MRWYTARASVLLSTAKTIVFEWYCLRLLRIVFSFSAILWRFASYQHRRNFASGVASFGNEQDSKRRTKPHSTRALLYCKPTTTIIPLAVKITIQPSWRLHRSVRSQSITLGADRIIRGIKECLLHSGLHAIFFCILIRSLAESSFEWDDANISKHADDPIAVFNGQRNMAQNLARNYCIITLSFFS